MESRIMATLRELQETADQALLAVRAANDRADRLIAVLRDVRAQLAASGSDAAGRAAVLATLKQTIAEIDEQNAQSDAAVQE
jgi:hypothetical protein